VSYSLSVVMLAVYSDSWKSSLRGDGMGRKVGRCSPIKSMLRQIPTDLFIPHASRRTFAIQSRNSEIAAERAIQYQTDCYRWGTTRIFSEMNARTFLLIQQPKGFLKRSESQKLDK
jgi:hypothetical protein